MDTWLADVRPATMRIAVAALCGAAVGFGLTSFRIAWPWLLALALAVLALALRRWFPLLPWVALGVALGATAWLALGLLYYIPQ